MESPELTNQVGQHARLLESALAAERDQHVKPALA
jgi:hypothetical protein